MKGELVGLWALLYLARYFGVSNLQACGDSTMVIKWFEGLQMLDVLSLDFWKRRIGTMVADFDSIKACHIYREYNTEVDILSKKSFDAKENVLIWWAKRDDQLGITQCFHLTNLEDTW